MACASPQTCRPILSSNCTFRGARILLVDDNDLNQEVATKC